MPSFNPTLADVIKRTEPGVNGGPGKIATIVEMLTETNEILQDMTYVEGNLPTGHKTTIRTGLPSAAWRMLNYGVQPSKSDTAQITDACGMLEAYAEVDKALVELNGNAAAFRLSEDRAFLEAMNQEMASTRFYGNEKTHPATFTGLAPRFSELSADRARSGYNVLSAGGSTADRQTSLWFVTWGPNICHGIYPKGSRGGWQHHDLGEVTLEDAQGGRYQGLRTHYKWDVGLTVRDWRGIVRVANIDTAKLDPAKSGSVDLIGMMVKAWNRLGAHRKQGRCVIYCNETVGTWLDIQAMSKSNVWLGMKEWAGTETLSFRGVPIRRCDAILDTESVVQAAA